MSDFIVEKLTKSVGDKTVFKEISFIIHELDRIGLIGVNGTGKTTLLDVLSGRSGYDGDRSPFSAKNDYKIGYLTQEPQFDDSKTVLDTVLSEDVKELQLIRQYELLTSQYDESQQAKLEKVMAEMDSLNAWEIESQVKTVLTKLGIQDLSAKVEKSKLDLASAQLDEEAQYDSMKDRIKFMYEGGGASLVQILLTSESMGDFLNKAEYVATISQYDRKMLEELQQVRSNVEQKQNDLEQQQSKLSGLQETLTSKRDELNSKISSTSGELADYQAQLDRAKAAEEALKLAQNDEVSGSVKADDTKNTETSNTNTNTNNANKNNQTASTNTNNTNKNNTTNTNSPTINNGNSTPASTTDVALLAAILQCEAGGYDGMLAVATVIMNRVASPAYPGNLRAVIYQSGQFAPTWNGSLNRVLSKGASSTAYSVAQAALGGARHSAVINCLQFRSASTGVSGINIGGNVFF